MKRMLSIGEAKEAITNYKNKNKTVGLITGNFDVIHIGHIRLINFAKENVDILFIGIDSDEVANSYREKEAHLINKTQNRAEVVSNIRNVDHVFIISPLNNKIPANSKETDILQTQLAKELEPNYIIANPLGDLYYKDRRKRCKKLGIELLELPNTAILE